MANALAENINEISFLSPKDEAVDQLRQVCRGLLREYGSIFLGIALHPMIERQREKCHRMGVSTQEVKDAIDSCRRR